MIYCLKNEVRTQVRKSTIENGLELIDSFFENSNYFVLNMRSTKE